MAGIQVRGFIGWLVWRVFAVLVPTWDRKVCLVLDWVVWPFVGRDIVNMQVGERNGVDDVLFEPGQAIVRQGDVGRRLFVIQTGEVEVVQRVPDGSEQLLAVLGPGEHFGETAVFQNLRRTATVRARTRVQPLAVGRSEAMALSNTLQPFAKEIQQLPGLERPEPNEHQ